MSRATEFFVVFAKSSTVSCTWSARSTELMKLGARTTVEWHPWVLLMCELCDRA